MVYAGYGVYTLWYMPGMGGIHPGIPTYVPPYVLPWYTHHGIHPIPPWVYHRPSMHHATVLTVCPSCGAECLGSVWEKPVGMKRREPPSPPSCYLCWEIVRRITPSFREERMNDRIDEGTTTGYYLGLGHVAQRGVHPMGYPIVEECVPLMVGWVRVNVSYSLPWAQGRLF